MKNIIKWSLLLASLWFLIHETAIIHDGLHDKLMHADIAVVLGNEVLSNKQPSNRLKSRLDKAVALYNLHYFSSIIVSGGTGPNGFSEADVMKLYLVSRGLPQKNIISDDAGINTAATAINAKRIMDRNGYKSAMIISQFFHISRIKLAFAKAGIRPVYSAHADYFETRDLYSLIREFFAYYRYLFLKI